MLSSEKSERLSMLSVTQKDGLTEIVNIAIGRSAALLSEMTGRKVNLSVPYIDLLTVNDMDTPVFSKIAVHNGHIISSSLKFGNDFKGKAFLLFPARQAKLLVGLCLDGSLENTSINDKDLLDTDFDVLMEISNVILNAIVGGLGNFLESKLIYSLPEIEMLFVSEEDQRVLLQEQMYVLVLQARLGLADTQFDGMVLIALSMDSVTQLVNRIDRLVGSLSGPT